MQPGDFVSYYVRARDLTRGTRPNEARSDIFFLEVKPYEQEFALAQSQGGMAGAGANGARRPRRRAEGSRRRDLEARSAAQAREGREVRAGHPVGRRAPKRSSRRASSRPRARSANRRCGIRGARQPQRRPRRAAAADRRLKAGETLPEEDDMTAAAAAMGKAVVSLDALKTADALPPEMEALNRLLKAQADVKKREVTRQQAGSGNGSNRSNFDLSSLFDKELQKAQQTNYETKSSAEQQAAIRTRARSTRSRISRGARTSCSRSSRSSRAEPRRR